MNDLITMNSRHTYWGHLNCSLYMTQQQILSKYQDSCLNKRKCAPRDARLPRPPFQVTLGMMLRNTRAQHLSPAQHLIVWFPQRPQNLIHSSTQETTLESNVVHLAAFMLPLTTREKEFRLS